MTFYSRAEEMSSSADRRFNKLAESLRSKSQPQLSLWWFTIVALKRSNSTDRRYNRPNRLATNYNLRPTGGRLSRRDAVMKRSSSRDRRHIKTCASEFGINNNASKPDSPDRGTDSVVSFARDRKTLFQRFMSKFPSAVKFIRKKFQTDEELDNNDTPARSGSFGYVGDTRNKRRRLKPKTDRSNVSGFDSVSLESYFCSEASLTPSPDLGDRNNSADDTTHNAEYTDEADGPSNDKTSAHNYSASNNEGVSPDRAAMIQQYHELLKCFRNNEANINQNACELEAQDREIEKYIEFTETHSDELARETAEFYNVKRVHKNFMDEATRVRVENKEHLLSADILQGDNAEMKEEITILCGKAGEVKERVALGLTEVIDDTAEMKLVNANMRIKNNIREREADAKRDELNEIKMAMQENGIQFKSRKPVYSFDGSAPLPPQMRGARSPTPSRQMDTGLMQQRRKAAKDGSDTEMARNNDAGPRQIQTPKIWPIFTYRQQQLFKRYPVGFTTKIPGPTANIPGYACRDEVTFIPSETHRGYYRYNYAHKRDEFVSIPFKTFVWQELIEVEQRVFERWCIEMKGRKLQNLKSTIVDSSRLNTQPKTTKKGNFKNIKSKLNTRRYKKVMIADECDALPANPVYNVVQVPSSDRSKAPTYRSPLPAILEESETDVSSTPRKSSTPVKVEVSKPNCKRPNKKEIKQIPMNNTGKFRNIQSKISTRRPTEDSKNSNGLKVETTQLPRRQNTPQGKYLPAVKLPIHVPINTKSSVTPYEKPLPAISAPRSLSKRPGTPRAKLLPPIVASPLLSNRPLTPYAKPLPAISKSDQESPGRSHHIPVSCTRVPTPQSMSLSNMGCTGTGDHKVDVNKLTPTRFPVVSPHPPPMPIRADTFQRKYKSRIPQRVTEPGDATIVQLPSMNATPVDAQESTGANSETSSPFDLK